MHTNDPELSKELDNIIEKYDALNPNKTNEEILADDKLFEEIDNAIKTNTSRRIDKYQNQRLKKQRKEKLNKIKNEK